MGEVGHDEDDVVSVSQARQQWNHIVPPSITTSERERERAIGLYYTGIKNGYHIEIQMAILWRLIICP